MADDGKGDGNGDGEGGLHPALIGAAALALAAVAFVVQNRRKVPVHWLFFDWRLPLWLLLLVTSALAIGAAEVAGWSLRRRRSH